jgi:hypothetical protein
MVAAAVAPKIFRMMPRFCEFNTPRALLCSAKVGNGHHRPWTDRHPFTRLPYTGEHGQ